MITVN